MGLRYCSSYFVKSIFLNVHDQILIATTWPLTVSPFPILAVIQFSLLEPELPVEPQVMDPSFCAGLIFLQHCASLIVVHLMMGCCHFVILQPVLCQNCAVSCVEIKRMPTS